VASLNQVDLIGLVASRPQHIDGAVGVIVLTPRGEGGMGVDRHRVIAACGSAVDISALAPGESVYVSGRLGRWGERRHRTAVIAAVAFSLLPPSLRPPCAGEHDEPTGRHHAPPVAHHRRGHGRILGRGTPFERLVWVRPTRVRGRQADDVATAGVGTGREGGSVDSDAWDER
jgi:hypothetical protein